LPHRIDENCMTTFSYGPARPRARERQRIATVVRQGGSAMTTSSRSKRASGSKREIRAHQTLPRQVALFLAALGAAFENRQDIS
jgi:hypothetical protein